VPPKESKRNLSISLLTVHVLDIPDKSREEEIQDDIAVFLSPVASQTPIGLDYDSLAISSQYTNDFWELIPDVLVRANEASSGIWQQTIWKISGAFIVPDEMAAEQAAQSIEWELYLEHKFDDEDVELTSYYWKVISAHFSSSQPIN
jgi:hypothetical protein